MRRPPDDAIAGAWFSTDKLARIRREEREAAAFRAMLPRRELFERRVAEAVEPPSKEQLRAMWAQADTEAKGDNRD